MKTIKLQLNKVPVDKIQSVYSGRPGCCCGCRGKHTDATPTTMRTINLITNKVKRAQEAGAELEWYGHHVALMSDTRWWVVYFTETVAELVKHHGGRR